MHILWRFVEDGPGRAFGRIRFIHHEAIEAQLQEQRSSSPRAVHSAPSAAARPDLVRALGEAWDWLATHDLLARDVSPRGAGQQVDPDGYFVTRPGFDVAATGTDALALIRAERRLGVELHPQVETRLRPLVSVGAFEQRLSTHFVTSK